MDYKTYSRMEKKFAEEGFVELPDHPAEKLAEIANDIDLHDLLKDDKEVNPCPLSGNGRRKFIQLLQRHKFFNPLIVEAMKSILKCDNASKVICAGVGIRQRTKEEDQQHWHSDQQTSIDNDYPSTRKPRQCVLFVNFRNYPWETLVFPRSHRNIHIEYNHQKEIKEWTIYRADEMYKIKSSVFLMHPAILYAGPATTKDHPKDELRFFMSFYVPDEFSLQEML